MGLGALAFPGHRLRRLEKKDANLRPVFSSELSKQSGSLRSLPSGQERRVPAWCRKGGANGDLIIWVHVWILAGFLGHPSPPPLALNAKHGLGDSLCCSFPGKVPLSPSRLPAPLLKVTRKTDTAASNGGEIGKLGDILRGNP